MHEDITSYVTFYLLSSTSFIFPLYQNYNNLEAIGSFVASGNHVAKLVQFVGGDVNIKTGNLE